VRVLFAIKSLNVVGGGAENVLVELANGLQSRGNEVGILTFDYPGQAFYALSGDIQRFDMAFNQPGQPTSPGQFFKAIPRIRNAVRDFQPDVLVPFMHSTFVPMALATLGMRVRSVFSEHVDYGHYIKNNAQYRLLKMAKRSVSCTTIPSRGALMTYPEQDRKGMRVVANPIQKAQLVGSVPHAHDDRPVVLSVGRLMTEKDHAVLIDAFSLVAAEFPDWTLRIVGEGQLRDALEAQVASYGLENRIELPGATRDVAAEYANARFVVLPSRYESFGMVAAEALAASKPVLSFAECAGLSEMVEDGRNGLLVKGGSSHEVRKNALADGLRKLMENPELCARLGTAGPDSVSQYDIESILDEWEALLVASEP
jgi:glycosyltransferase involved in cell wall biosynthesis